jgi:hypothetical protein
MYLDPAVVPSDPHAMEEVDLILPPQLQQQLAAAGRGLRVVVTASAGVQQVHANLVLRPGGDGWPTQGRVALRLPCCCGPLLLVHLLSTPAGGAQDAAGGGGTWLQQAFDHEFDSDVDGCSSSSEAEFDGWTCSHLAIGAAGAGALPPGIAVFDTNDRAFSKAGAWEVGSQAGLGGGGFAWGARAAPARAAAAAAAAAAAQDVPLTTLPLLVLPEEAAEEIGILWGSLVCLQMAQSTEVGADSAAARCYSHTFMGFAYELASLLQLCSASVRASAGSSSWLEQATADMRGYLEGNGLHACAGLLGALGGDGGGGAQ